MTGLPGLLDACPYVRRFFEVRAVVGWPEALPSFIYPIIPLLDLRRLFTVCAKVDWHLGGGEAGLGRGGAQDGVAVDDRETLEQERVAAILEETSRAFINTSLVGCLATGQQQQQLLALRTL